MTTDSASGALVDGFGRRHTSLRVSLTDRCSLRCSYCMPAEGLPWLTQPDLLSTAELIRLIAVAQRLGITDFRLTGGEPLLRADVVDVVAAIRALPTQPHVALTTNGLRLSEVAAALKAAGLQRVNVSLDTLQPQRFEQIAKRSRLDDVLAGLQAASRVGLQPVKINTVLLRGVNDDEALDLLRFCIEHGYELRFIEQMPLDPQHGWSREQMVSAPEILAQLRTAYLVTEQATRDTAPATKFDVDGGLATVGIVASVSAPFCSSCDRLRLTADGQFRPCLFGDRETDLRTPMRDGASDDQLADLMVATVRNKKAAHGIGEPGFSQPDRPMSAIGG